jgi:hypothetical protein
MEAVDTDENRILWHDTVNVPATNLVLLQAQIAAMSRGKLAGALGVRDFVREVAPAPGNEEAYELYLKSLALEFDRRLTSRASLCFSALWLSILLTLLLGACSRSAITTILV